MKECKMQPAKGFEIQHLFLVLNLKQTACFFKQEVENNEKGPDNEKKGEIKI